MKLKFKKQAYQTLATEAVVDCFKGQPNTSGINYRIDPGVRYRDSKGYSQAELQEEAGFKNADIALNGLQILENIPPKNKGYASILSKKYRNVELRAMDLYAGGLHWRQEES